jgi:SsrA-binding protein
MEPRAINIQNRSARFEFEIIDEFDAGIMLKGTEIKAIREGGGSFNDAYCIVKDGELFLKNLHIPEYKMGSFTNHEPTRLRKLLLKKRELNKIDAKMRERGLSVVPLKLFMSDRGLAKIQIGLGRGKKTFDKRDSLKQKDSKRDMDRELKRFK